MNWHTTDHRKEILDKNMMKHKYQTHCIDTEHIINVYNTYMYMYTITFTCIRMI